MIEALNSAAHTRAQREGSARPRIAPEGGLAARACVRRGGRPGDHAPLHTLSSPETTATAPVAPALAVSWSKDFGPRHDSLAFMIVAGALFIDAIFGHGLGPGVSTLVFTFSIDGGLY